MRVLELGTLGLERVVRVLQRVARGGRLRGRPSSRRLAIRSSTSVVTERASSASTSSSSAVHARGRHVHHAQRPHRLPVERRGRSAGVGVHPVPRHRRHPARARVDPRVGDGEHAGGRAGGPTRPRSGGRTTRRAASRAPTPAARGARRRRCRTAGRRRRASPWRAARAAASRRAPRAGRTTPRWARRAARSRAAPRAVRDRRAPAARPPVRPSAASRTARVGRRRARTDGRSCAALLHGYRRSPPLPRSAALRRRLRRRRGKPPRRPKCRPRVGTGCVSLLHGPAQPPGPQARTCHRPGHERRWAALWCPVVPSGALWSADTDRREPTGPIVRGRSVTPSRGLPPRAACVGAWGSASEAGYARADCRLTAGEPLPPASPVRRAGMHRMPARVRHRARTQANRFVARDRVSPARRGPDAGSAFTVPIRDATLAEHPERSCWEPFQKPTRTSSKLDGTPRVGACPPDALHRGRHDAPPAPRSDTRAESPHRSGVIRRRACTRLSGDMRGVPSSSDDDRVGRRRRSAVRPLPRPHTARARRRARRRAQRL